MSALRYCQTCILPHTRPGLQFDAEGNCNCATAAKKDAINWRAREQEFRELVAAVKARSALTTALFRSAGAKTAPGRC